MNRTTTNEPTSDSARLLEAIRSSNRKPVLFPAFRHDELDSIDVAPDGISATVTTKGTNHTAHAVVALLTLGLWLPIWAGVAMIQRRKMYIVTLDSQGHATWKQVDA